MRRRSLHAVFGATTLSGLWQPEDLYSNCRSKRVMRSAQSLWEFGAGRACRTKHGKLKSAPLVNQAEWNVVAVEDLRKHGEPVITSFKWGG